MPRKTAKPRKAAKTPVTQDTKRRQAPDKRPPAALNAARQKRPAPVRPPKFPGRLGGR